MSSLKNELFDTMAGYISKGDLYAATAIAKISAFIFQTRRKLNLTQTAFAEMMGVSQGMVSKWESADYNFTIENIARIAERLNMTFDIEFNAESEYLKNSGINEYDSTHIKTNWDLCTVINRNDLAA